MDINLYIKGGKISRTDIVSDIKNRRLSRTDVEELLSDDRVKSVFIGSEYSKKKPANEWNQDYLDKLSYAAIAEAFNEDYLLHLCDVAENVESKRHIKKSHTPIIIAAICVFVTFIITTIILLNGNS